MNLRWTIVRRRKVIESGTGRTLDLSSGGILFDAGRHLAPGAGVEISIAWPAILNDGAPLQLVVIGRVVRADGDRAAVHVSQHEFRTVAAEPYSRIPRPHNIAGLKIVRPAKFVTNS